jgi:hypothetical protein
MMVPGRLEAKRQALEAGQEYQSHVNQRAAQLGKYAPRYQIHTLIGKGSFGKVFRAYVASIAFLPTRITSIKTAFTDVTSFCTGKTQPHTSKSPSKSLTWTWQTATIQAFEMPTLLKKFNKKLLSYNGLEIWMLRM